MSCELDPNQTGTGYAYYGCRCVDCRAVHRRRQGRSRHQRMDARVLVDGRLVAPLPPDRHGKVGTYRYHGCRCVPCTVANAQALRDYRAGVR
jgi:hypothetical protein